MEDGVEFDRAEIEDGRRIAGNPLHARVARGAGVARHPESPRSTYYYANVQLCAGEQARSAEQAQPASKRTW